MGERATWNDKYARRIDNLPILNVDDALLNYGADVSSLLRGAGLTIRTSNMDAGVNQSRNMVFGDYYSMNNQATYNMQNQANAYRNGQQKHLENLSKIDEMTRDMRRKMTEKYQLEF